MVDTLILVLFVVSGAAAGWLGVDLLPEQQLIRIQNLEQLSWILGGGGALAGLLAGVVFQRLRRRLMEQVRTMPTCGFPVGDGQKRTRTSDMRARVVHEGGSKRRCQSKR